MDEGLKEKIKAIQEAYNKGLATGVELERLRKEEKQKDELRRRKTKENRRGH